MENFKRGFTLDRIASGATSKTLQWHGTALKRFELFLADTDQSSVPSDWTPMLLREFIVWLQNQKGRGGEQMSPFSVRTYLNSVFAFCRWLYDEEVIDKDITARVKKPKLPDTQKHAFTSEEIARMLDAVSRRRYKLRDTAILLTLLDTGLRSSELCNLKYEDYLQGDLLLIVRQGKGRKDRVAPISVKTAVAISKYLNKERIVPTEIGTPLFANQRDGHLTTSGLLQLTKAVSKLSGVLDVHPHRFRHTAALYLLRNGADLMTVQRILGHTDLSMTRKYVNLLNEDLSRVHSFASPVANLK